MTTRREMLCGMMGAAASRALASAPSAPVSKPVSAHLLPAAESEPINRGKALESGLISKWESAAKVVSPAIYKKYLNDGDTHGLAALEALERSFEKVASEIKSVEVTGDAPAIWSVYNMGYVIKTRKSLFSIDLVHRRDTELAKMLDFALITHNHDDHWRQGFYDAVNSSGKTVISNFLDNFGARDFRRNGGYTRANKVFKIRDVEIRTSLIDHNEYLVDFTTAFEIRIGNWILYHTGDSGKGTEQKLGTSWGRPDLWLFFPISGIDVAKAVEKVQSKRIVFGHLWELAHRHEIGRLTEPLIRKNLAAARLSCDDVSVAFWGDRII